MRLCRSKESRQGVNLNGGMSTGPASYYRPLHLDPHEVVPDVKVQPVWTSYSWWLTLVPTIAGVIGFFWHKQIDLSPIAGAIALLGSSLCTGLFVLARAIRHRTVLQMQTHRLQIRADLLQHNAGNEALTQAFNAVSNDIDNLTNHVRALTPAPPRRAARKTASRRRA